MGVGKGADLWAVKINGVTIKAFVFDEETAVVAGVLSEENCNFMLCSKRLGPAKICHLFELLCYELQSTKIK